MAGNEPFSFSYDPAIMKTASVSDMASDFAGYLKASQRGPVVVTSKGKPVAVLLRTAGREDLERVLMGHSPKLQSILEEARKRFRAGAGIPHEVFWKEIEEETARGAKKPTKKSKNGRSSSRR
jgi:prevent-host-death family protein